MNMKCIACGQHAEKTVIRGDIEAAFCDNHYPRENSSFVIRVYVRF